MRGRLRRTIGSKTLLLLSINSILGSSIFFMPSIAASYSGASSVVAWILMSIIAIATSTYFAELVSMFPKTGGIYEYSKHAFGEFHSFLIGWISWVVANIAIALEIIGSLLYVFHGYSAAFTAALSIAFILFFNYIAYRGIDYSSKMLSIFGFMTLLAIVSILLPGAAAINPDNLFFSLSMPSLLLTLYFVSDVFFGWESATYLSEEVKNARRVMPRVLVMSTVIVGLLATCLAVVSLGVVNWKVLINESAPLNAVASAIYGSSGQFSTLIFIVIMGTAASWIVSSPRLLYAMSRDHVLVPRFHKIHPEYRTPHNAIMLQAAATIIFTLVGFADYKTLLFLVLPLEIIMYSWLMLIVIRFRNAKKPYKSPFGAFGAASIFVFNIAILFMWLTHVSAAASLFTMGIAVVSFGVPMYIVIKISTDSRFVEKFFDRASWFFDKTFPVWYSSAEMKKVLNKIDMPKNCVILDFGCGSGITTLQLAKRVGKKGTIVAVDISEAQLTRAFKKIEKAMKISNVVFIKEHQLTFEPESFDAVTAVGVLEHLGRPEETLERIFSHLKKGGTFSFLSFGKTFGIPAPEFLSSKEKILELFACLGTKPNIRIEKKRLTEYIYIWGRKWIPLN
jgi:amino acid transporter/ubiquinone/menaquinone biosynthesis C-methylase UbiE